MKKYTILPEMQEISPLIEEIQSELTTNCKVSASDAMEACITLEDTLISLVSLTPETEKIHISISKGIRKTVLRVAARGQQMDEKALFAQTTKDMSLGEYSPEAEDTIRQMVFTAFSDRLSSKYSKGVNTVSILVQKSQNAELYDALTALVAAIVIGSICRLALPADVCKMVGDYVFAPLYNIFLNAIRMVMAPLVFFSLAACVAGFSDLRSLGRMGAKVVSGYVLTTCIAIAVSMGILQLFNLTPMDIPGLNSGQEAQDQVQVSLIDTMLNIIPTNFVGAFNTADMMQIIFLSLLVGAAASSLGKTSSQVISLISAGEALFNKITSFIVRLLPFAIFGSFALLIITINLSTMQILASWVMIIILSMLCMIVIYTLALVFVARINPMMFFRNYAKVIITALSTCSSGSTIPIAMECCKKVGVSPRLYSFSIPLGATISMNGTSIMYIVTTFFLAALTGTQIDTGTMTTILFTTVMIAMAAPGVPGAGTACVLLLLSLGGIPSGGFALVLGLMPLVEPLLTACNVLSDGVVTAMVARNEHLLETE